MWREKLAVKKSNVIAGLYPLAKLWILALYCCIVFILITIKVNGYPFFLMSAVFIPMILSAATGVFRGYVKVISKICILAAVIITAQMLLFPGPNVLWKLQVFNLFAIRVYENGVQKGFTLAFSILDIGGIFVWFFQCTENKELIYACEKRGMSPKAGYVLLSTLQMISVLQQSSRVIMSAQEARGVETKGNLKVRMKAFLPSLIPLILGAINNTEERVLTLESKGFTAHCKKTRLLTIKPNGKEKAAVAASVFAVTLVVVWRVLLWVL